MFKSRYSTYRKRKRSLPLLMMIMTIPLVLILLELSARLLVGVMDKNAELANYEGEPAIVNVYRLKFLNEAQKPYDALSNRGRLAAQRSLAVGYRLMGKQQSNFWQINEQGFRDDDSVPLLKPKNEIRIFLLGGSTAFGQWNPSNQATLASQLEARLNERIAQQRRSPEKYRPAELPFYKPDLAKALALPSKIRDGQYRVINAAVPGYTSGNELAQLALQILPYKPDAIIVLDGYGDLLLPSDRIAADIPHAEAFLSNAPGHFWTHLTQQLKYAIADTYLVKATQYWLLRPQLSASRLSLAAMDESAPLDHYLPTDPTELERRVTRYSDFHKQMVRLTAGAGIPLVIALQPEITGRGTKQISVREQKTLNELGSAYQQRVQVGYGELARVIQQLQKAFPKNVKTLNFYQVYENFPELAFLDAIHLTEEGNGVLSERLYHTLTALRKLQVPPSRPLP
ncbi:MULTISPECIES: SGNH/GDSL hydrolase family protein [unclassified Coleofasciculus]|uniref:SGNH/GDSL hydrolase family protein n=1 Tax=unclassified Coleofasciculus TaxID=2692782 RepID=UPI001882B270|nr:MULTISPECIES: SGNH/GDSL hydrolase family protein [unclassified Coleofasciculus]MBE9129007.1 SGNH/GDSL hydrolase family protein [Coleofasciculus sp. LEGE 07081]MBE9151586.1 SGNH/GDSL hydrolase family protein [Coleofasciculus sp. LEGE 07092]